MKDDPPPPRFFITPLQWLLACFGLALAGALAVVALRSQPRPETLWEWRYPDQYAGTYWPTQTVAPIQSMVDLIATNGSNVSGFYRKSLRLPAAKGPLFMSTSRGALFSRRSEQIGLVPLIGTTNLHSEMFLQHSRGQSKIILVSQSAGNSNTTIFLNLVGASDSPRPLWIFQSFITYPGSVSIGGGSMLSLQGYTYTVKTNLAAVERFYTNSFGAKISSTIQSNALRAIGDSSTRLCRLSGGSPLFPTNEIAFLLVTPKTMSLIHAVGVTSNSVSMSIGVVAR